MLLRPFAAGLDLGTDLEGGKICLTSSLSGHLQHRRPFALLFFFFFFGIFLYKLCHFQCEFQRQVCSSHLHKLAKTSRAGPVRHIPPTCVHEASGIASHPQRQQPSDGSLGVLEGSQYRVEVSVIFRDTEVFRSVQKVWGSRSVGS